MEGAFNSINEHGKFQKLITCTILAVSFICPIMCVGFPFLTAKPEMLCRIKNNEIKQYSSCQNGEMCQHDTFDIIIDHNNSLNNFTLEFGLYCERSFYVPLLGTTFFIGTVVGSFLLSSLPDYYGREKTFKLLSLSVCALQLNMIMIQSPIHLVISNFFNGFVFLLGTLTISITITEYIARDNAAILFSINNSMFPISGVFIMIFFLTINSWKLCFKISFLISFFACILSFKYFCESPRWLLAQNKTTDCIEVLKKIAIINGTQENLFIYLQNNQSNYFIKIALDTPTPTSIQKEFLSLVQIFKLRSQFKLILINTYLWFAAGCCFFGLSLNLEKLDGNIFLNSFIAYAAEAVAELISGYMSDRFGRIFILKLFGGFGGISFLLYEIISVQSLKAFLLFSTSFGFAGFFNVICIYSPEVFPTSIRGSTMGFLLLCSRLGALIVPSISAAIYYSNSIYAVMALLTCLLATGLPETLGKGIQDDIPENIKHGLFLFGDKLPVRKSKKNIKRYTVVEDSFFMKELL
jgi:putative MFS transporter